MTCVVDFRAAVFLCEHCKATTPFPWPTRLTTLKVLLDDFKKKHKHRKGQKKATLAKRSTAAHL